MESKNIIVVLLVVIAAVLLYYYLSQPDNKDVFLETLLNSEKVYIVMDVRGVSNQTIKNGIFQCGVDFAGSPGLAGKNITSLAIEEGSCWGINNATVEDCLAVVEEGPTLYITSGTQSEYFENKLVVSIDQDYVYGSCGITAVQKE